ncbi:MAG: SH3 domain-containing protein [Methylotenera sp.]|uniref:SH3 domain-containing protein n=1 Tax=Methylotenera sp. TaxID=2051956 RepID=UPI002488DE46|nr:SH3 domain-containing protein [Methylotenera sp.]MDI1307825.1 SH3 domain-containing protein [Methylotenera sp.]
MRKLTQWLIAASFPALLLANNSMAAEKGSALKNDSIRFEPYADAKVTGSLSRGDSLEIISKKGAWLQVKSKKSAGWVRLLSVKRGSSSSSSQVGGVLAAASGRAGTGQVVSTTGIRGLSAEELKAAKFNEVEVKTLESYTQSAEQGRQFAKSGKLKTVSFPNLKAVPNQTAVNGGSK